MSMSAHPTARIYSQVDKPQVVLIKSCTSRIEKFQTRFFEQISDIPAYGHSFPHCAVEQQEVDTRCVVHREREQQPDHSLRDPESVHYLLGSRWPFLAISPLCRPGKCTAFGLSRHADEPLYHRESLGPSALRQGTLLPVLLGSRHRPLRRVLHQIRKAAADSNPTE
jgi:hypothetical protein